MRLAIDEDQKRQTWSFLGGAVRRPIDASLNGKILADGPMERLDFSLTFNSDLPVWELGGQGSGFAGAGHIEQVGRVTGTVSFGHYRVEIDSFMNRDHSRGPRLMSSLARHIWFQGMLSDGRYFLAYEAQEASLEQTSFSECCVIDGGALYKGELEVLFQLPFEGGMAHIHDPLPFRIRYEKGEIKGQVVHFPTTMHHQFTYPWDSYIGSMDIGSDTRRMIEQATLYKIDGGVTGYGHMERTVPGRLLNDFELI